MYSQNIQCIIMIILISLSLFYGLFIGIKGCTEMTRTTNKIVKFFNGLFCICLVSYIIICLSCLTYYIILLLNIQSLQTWIYLIGLIGNISYHIVLYSLLYTSIARLHFAFNATIYQLSPTCYKCIISITITLTILTATNFIIMQFGRFFKIDQLIQLTVFASLGLVLCYIAFSWAITIIFGIKLYKLMISTNQTLCVITDNTATIAEEQWNINDLKLSNINTNSNNTANTPQNEDDDVNIVDIENEERNILNEDQLDIMHKISKYLCLAAIQFTSTFIMFTCLAVFRAFNTYSFGGDSLFIIMDCVINISCLYLTFIFAVDIYNKTCRCWSNICNKCITSHALRQINS